MGAGRYWAGEKPSREGLEEDFEYIDLPESHPWRQPVEPENFEVMSENWEALQVFLACGTQWRTGAMGGALGIDYGGLNSVMDMMRIDDRKTVFQEVRLIEQGALESLNKK